MKSIIKYLTRSILPSPKVINHSFEYQLDQVVYFLYNNAIQEGHVIECTIRVGGMSTNGEPITEYRVAWGDGYERTMRSAHVSTIKKELVQSLLKD